MGYIISLVSQKGGSGKTTISVNLAGALAEHLKEVLLIDADAQQSALNWRAAAGESGFPIHVIGMAQPVLHQEAPKHAAKYPLVVIDSPSGFHDSTIPRSAMAAAHMVIIPVQPSAVDIWAARDTIRLIQEIKIVNPNLQAMLVVSRAITGTRLSGEAREALEALGLPVFKTQISQRIALAEAPLGGKLILDYPNPAREEFRSLALEVLEVLSHGKEITQASA